MYMRAIPRAAALLRQPLLGAVRTHMPMVTRSVVQGPTVLQSVRFQTSGPKQENTTAGANPTPEHKQNSDGQKADVKPKVSLMERFRAIMRNYGWWALGVYMIMSGIDLSVAFICVHYAGGEYIKDLENKARELFGVSKKEIKEASAKDESPANTLLRHLAKDEATEQLIAQLTTEFVIAFGIHKTLFLPLRAGITALITPRLVHWLIRRGWARPLRAATAPPRTP